MSDTMKSPDDDKLRYTFCSGESYNWKQQKCSEGRNLPRAEMFWAFLLCCSQKNVQCPQAAHFFEGRYKILVKSFVSRISLFRHFIKLFIPGVLGDKIGTMIKLNNLMYMRYWKQSPAHAKYMAVDTSNYRFKEEMSL